MPSRPPNALAIVTALAAMVSTTTGKFCLLATCVYTTALCAIPLFGVHGVESAFALGLILPITTALHVEARDRAARAVTSLTRLRQATEVAGLHVGLATLILALNSLRIQQCEPWLGLAYIGLGPGIGCLLASQFAFLLCRAATPAWKRRILVVALPLVGLARFAWAFYSTPSIFAYGHFFGYFPGSFYDELIQFPLPLLALRLGTGCMVAAGTLFAFATSSIKEGHIRRRLFGILLLFILAAGGLEYSGPALGFRVSATRIQAELGATYTSKRCVIHLPREYPHAARFGADCDFAVREAEQFLGLRQDAPVRVYLFRNADEKRRLIGAASTNVAKPWRSEVYVQVGAYPHPVLPHEIAHVVAGASGSGPLRIAGTFGGLWPNMGLIEGIAVAADFRAVGELTPHQWAKAAVDEGIAPPITTLFGPGFLGHRPGLAYTLAGSFIRFAHSTRGRKPLLLAYRTGDLERAFERGLPRLEHEWHDFLKTVELRTGARALARRRFSGRSVLSAICPHRVAALRSDLHADLLAHNWDAALETCAALVRLDDKNQHSNIIQIKTLATANHLHEAEALLRKVDPESAYPGLLGDARESLADGYYRAGQFSRAAAIYGDLLSTPQHDARRRQRQVKRISALSPAPVRSLLTEIFVPAQGTQTAPAITVHLARELSDVRADGLGQYLESRQLYFAGEPARAAPLLDIAIGKGLPSEELKREAQRLSAMCHLEAGSLQIAAQRFRKLARSPYAATAYNAERFLRRIHFMHQSRNY